MPSWISFEYWEGFRRAVTGHPGTQALKALGTRALEHLWHSGTWVLKYLGTQSLGTYRALRHLANRLLKTLGHSGTRAFRALRHLGTQVLAHSVIQTLIGHLDTWPIAYSRHSGTRALEALYLIDSIFGHEKYQYFSASYIL